MNKEDTSVLLILFCCALLKGLTTVAIRVKDFS